MGFFNASPAASTECRSPALIERLEDRQLFAATPIDITGTFGGALTVKKVPEAIVFTVVDTSGAISGLLTTTQLTTPAPYSGTIKGRKVTFTVTEGGVLFTAKATVSKDGTTLIGTFNGGKGKTAVKGRLVATKR